MSPNKKVTKEVGIGEELSSLLPHSKPSLPYVPLPRELTMARHRSSVVIGFMAVGKDTKPKEMETEVQYVMYGT